MVTFLLLNGGAVLAALLVARAAGAGAGTSRLVLCTLSGYLVIVHSVVLVAGLAGWLTVSGMLVLVAMALAGAAWRARRLRHDHEMRQAGARFTGTALFPPLVALATAATWTWPHVFEATNLWIWDDYSYHMVYPALWLREHAIAAVTPAQTFTMQAWYPLSASVVATWFMLPFAGSRGDALAWVSLTGPLYAVIVGSAAAELLGRLGCRRGAWAVPVVLFTTSHRIAVMAGSFSDADLAHAAALFAAFVFAIPRDDGESGRDVGIDTGYAALLTGLGLGVKVSAAPIALIILLMTAVRASAVATAGGRFRLGVRIALVFVTAWAATAGYWYVRNLVHTGNPVYPAAFLTWPGTTFPETTLLEYGRHYGFRRALGDALAVYMNWPRSHAVLAVIGLAGLAGWLVLRRRAMTRAQTYFTRGALVVAAVMLVVLPTTPYSAGNAMTFVSGFIHWDSMRYVALLPLLGWAALGFLIDAGAGAPHGRTLAATLVTIAAVLASDIAWRPSLLLLAAAVVCAALVARIRPRLDGRPFAARTTAIGATAALLVTAGFVVWSHGAKVAATTAAFYREPLFGAAVAVFDRLPPGTRVALFGDQWTYPAFGARHHLVPVRLDRDGRMPTSQIGAAFESGDLTVDPSTFRSNLAGSGIGVVAVVHLPHPGRSPQWPTQAAALDAMADARVLHRDVAVGIWKLGR